MHANSVLIHCYLEKSICYRGLPETFVKSGHGVIKSLIIILYYSVTADRVCPKLGTVSPMCYHTYNAPLTSVTDLVCPKSEAF